MAGTLYIVATPIGNLDDISARALRVLKEVSVIAAEDTRRTHHLLQRYGLTTRSTSFHEHNAKSKAPELIDRLLAGESVALVTDAGTPGISDPGHELVGLAHERQIPVVPIPGASAVTAALSVCGFPGTGFVFLGFPPSKGSERRAWFEKFAAAQGVVPLVVFYEAPHRIRQTLDEIGVKFGRLPVCVCRELTKVHEVVEVGYVTKMAPPSEVGEFVVVVNIGDLTNMVGRQTPPSPTQIALEFVQMTKSEGLRRRQAISALSRKYDLPAREIYAMVESEKPPV